jgi:hypothetical protein
MQFIVNETIWGKAYIRRIRFQNDLYLECELLQVEGGEYTSHGFHYVPRSRVQLGSHSILRKLTYTSLDLLGKSGDTLAQKEFKGVGFPQRTKIRHYKMGHLKVFVRQWKLAPTTEELAKNLGIPQKKVWALAKFLRSKKVFLPLKSDEKHTKRPERKKINWTHFVRAVKGAKYAETAATMVGMELERFLFCCQFLQSKGVRLVIPPMDDCPDWLRIRAGNDLKQIISVRSKHGSGKNFKQRWAGYAKKTVMNMAGCEWL